MEFVIGTMDDGRAWIDRESEPIHGQYPVSADRVRDLAMAVRDPNPMFWDESHATETRWGRPIAPNTSMWNWCLPEEWTPDWMGVTDGVPFIVQVPLPGDAVVVVESEQEYVTPIYIGDELSYTQMVTGIEPKTTRLGEGCFVRSTSTYRNQDSEIVGYNRVTYFRFRRGTGETT